MITTQTNENDTYPDTHFSVNIFPFEVVNDVQEKTERSNDLEPLLKFHGGKLQCEFLLNTDPMGVICTIQKDPVRFHIRDKMIDQIRFRKDWEKKKINPPNILSKHLTIEICFHLFDKYELIPQRINASIEGGILITYLNTQNQYTLSVEIYNDLQVAALVNDNNAKKIVKSQDITDLTFDGIMRYFNG